MPGITSSKKPSCPGGQCTLVRHSSGLFVVRPQDIQGISVSTSIRCISVTVRWAVSAKHGAAGRLDARGNTAQHLLQKRNLAGERGKWTEDVHLHSCYCDSAWFYFPFAQVWTTRLHKVVDGENLAPCLVVPREPKSDVVYMQVDLPGTSSCNSLLVGWREETPCKISLKCFYYNCSENAPPPACTFLEALCQATFIGSSEHAMVQNIHVRIFLQQVQYNASGKQDSGARLDLLLPVPVRCNSAEVKSVIVL